MKIEYDKDGWVCDRYPRLVTESVGEMEVTDEEYIMTLATGDHFAWRVVDGELVNERYEETPIEEIREERIQELKQFLINSDYKAIKHSEGLLTDEEYAPIKAQRQAWRDEINELEKYINQND